MDWSVAVPYPPSRARTIPFKKTSHGTSARVFSLRTNFAIHQPHHRIHPPRNMQSLRSLWPRAAAPRRAFSTTSPRSLARMQLLGRLGDAPEVNATSSGQEIIRLSLGVSSGPKSEDGTRNTSWFRLTSFAEGPKKEVLCGLQKGYVGRCGAGEARRWL